MESGKEEHWLSRIGKGASGLTPHCPMKCCLIWGFKPTKWGWLGDMVQQQLRKISGQLQKMELGPPRVLGKQH